MRTECKHDPNSSTTGSL